MLKLGSLIVDLLVNTEQLDEAEKKTKKSTSAMSAAFKKLGAVMLAAFTVDRVVQAAKLADQMRVLQGRILRVTKSAEGFNTAWQAINKSADEAGVSIADAAGSFERFLMATEQMGATIDDVAKFNDLILKTGTISGSSATELSNALTQLSQGFQGGIIRAEEWNSIIEQSPEILRVAAKNIEGVNGDLGELRKLMLEGGLTADKFFNAFMAGADDIEKEFAKIPKSLEQSMQTLNNQYTRMITNLDTQYKVTEKLANMLGYLADQFDEVANATDTVKNLEAQNKLLLKNIEHIKTLADEGNKGAAIQLEKSQAIYDANKKEIDQLNEKYGLLKQIAETKPLEKAQEDPNAAGVGEDGPIIPDNIKALNELKEEAKNYYIDLMNLNQSATDAIYDVWAEHDRKLDQLVEDDLLDAGLAAQAKIEMEKNMVAQLDAIDQEAADKEKQRRQEEITALAGMATSIGTIMGSLTTDTDSGLAKTANAFRTFAVSMVASSQAIAAASALGGPDAALMGTAEKLMHYATIMGAFATISSSLAGSRMNGGGMQQGGMYAINESGKSEILNEGGKQYLLAGKNASITGQGAMTQTNGYSNSNVMTVQQSISVTGTGDEELISKMAQAAQQGAQMAESNYIKQMNNKTGRMYAANRQTYGSGRTTGRPM